MSELEIRLRLADLAQTLGLLGSEVTRDALAAMEAVRALNAEAEAYLTACKAVMRAAEEEAGDGQMTLLASLATRLALYAATTPSGEGAFLLAASGERLDFTDRSERRSPDKLAGEAAVTPLGGFAPILPSAVNLNGTHVEILNPDGRDFGADRLVCSSRLATFLSYFNSLPMVEGGRYPSQGQLFR